MLQIGDVLVTLDIVEKFFCCDLDACKGACCIEGDAGAPVTEDEIRQIRESYDSFSDELTPQGINTIREEGYCYLDPEGELVTQIMPESGTCVYACFAKDGMCLCAIEKAMRQGKTKTQKPISCFLYPLRIKEYEKFTVVNYHRWDICRPAEKLGKKLGIRLYQFLKEPLIRRFGKEWYDELQFTCEEYLRQYPDGIANS